MIDPDGLNVWCGQSLVGFLWRNKVGQIGFNYAQDWLESKGGFRLSISLPLRTEDYSPEEGVAHRFFANLLPEGGARDQLVRDLKISNTDFDLLRAIGGECAGALSLLPSEQSPSVNHKYKELTDTELTELVQRKGQPTTWNGPDRPRLSLAGAQSKCPVMISDNIYYLPQNESPSTHILKFEVSDYRHLPAYETFTIQLASQLGLGVIDMSLQYAGNVPFACAERYDRAIDVAPIIIFKQMEKSYG